MQNIQNRIKLEKAIAKFMFKKGSYDLNRIKNEEFKAKVKAELIALGAPEEKFE